MVKRKNHAKINEELIKKAARLLKGETLTPEQNEDYSLHKRTIKKYKRLAINIHNRNEQWSMDLADMKELQNYNSGYRYWLVCIDIHSRYLFVRLLKNKSSNNVANKFENILTTSGETPKKIQSDEGTEFQKIRNVLSKKYNFTVFSTFNREIKASHAERVIQTLKQMVRRVITVTNDYRYSHILPIIVQRYNESPHRALFNNTPENKYIKRKKIPFKKYLLNEIKNPTPTKNILKVGTLVRIARSKSSVFEKSSLRRWVQEKFKINKVFITNPVTYELVDLEGEQITGKFYREELQKAIL